MKEKAKTTEVVKKRFGGPQEGSGRPLLPIDPDQVYRLAEIHCTVKEIASILNCSEDTIFERFSDTLHRGWNHGQMSLKRKMHKIALDDEGDGKMLIWLSKQRCAYKEQQPEDATQINFNVFCREIPK